MIAFSCNFHDFKCASLSFKRFGLRKMHFVWMHDDNFIKEMISAVISLCGPGLSINQIFVFRSTKFFLYKNAGSKCDSKYLWPKPITKVVSNIFFSFISLSQQFIVVYFFRHFRGKAWSTCESTQTPINNALIYVHYCSIIAVSRARLLFSMLFQHWLPFQMAPTTIVVSLFLFSHHGRRKKERKHCVNALIVGH